MNPKCYIVSLALFGLVSCTTVQLSVDDAYHWEDPASTPSTTSTANTASKPSATSTPSNQPVKISSGSAIIVAPSDTKIITDRPISPATSSSSSTPSLEFINVQDTTITVRIKR